MAYKVKNYTYNDGLSIEENTLLDRLYKLRMSGMAESLEKQFLDRSVGICKIDVRTGILISAALNARITSCFIIMHLCFIYLMRLHPGFILFPRLGVLQGTSRGKPVANDTALFIYENFRLSVKRKLIYGSIVYTCGMEPVPSLSVLIYSAVT